MIDWEPSVWRLPLKKLVKVTLVSDIVIIGCSWNWPCGGFHLFPTEIREKLFGALSSFVSPQTMRISEGIKCFDLFNKYGVWRVLIIAFSQKCSVRLRPRRIIQISVRLHISNLYTRPTAKSLSEWPRTRSIPGWTRASGEFSQGKERR